MSGQSTSIDPELDLVEAWFHQQGDLVDTFGVAVRTALDEVIETARTTRWSLEQCGNQEKAYVGVKLENVVRGVFRFEQGALGMDFEVVGVDVDCKWSKSWGRWQIPREAVGHICLLIWADDPRCEIAVGLIRIREQILVGGNQDKKRTIQSPGGMSEIRWLVPKTPSLPPNFLLQLPDVDRCAILAHRGGDARARELFSRCEGVILQRHTIESIGQQTDEGRRFRGETRAQLLTAGYEVLNGHWRAHKKRAAQLGGPIPQNSREWVCLRSDGSTPSRLEARLAARLADAEGPRLF